MKKKIVEINKFIFYKGGRERERKGGVYRFFVCVFIKVIGR